MNIYTGCLLALTVWLILVAIILVFFKGAFGGDNGDDPLL